MNLSSESQSYELQMETHNTESCLMREIEMIVIGFTILELGQ